MKDYRTEPFRNLQESVLRRYAEEAMKRGLLSFTNGNPSAETFEVEKLAEFARQSLLEDREKALRYNFALGYPKLRDTLKERISKNIGIDFDRNELAVTSGGMQAMDLVSKIFLGKEDSVVSEEPAFGTSYNIFRIYGKNIYGVKVLDDGMDIEQLAKTLQEHPEIKMLYTISSFQNPTGFTTSAKKRRKIIELAQKYDILVMEDDPYIELRYSGETVKPIKCLDTDGRVFYASSLSKILAPAFRVGYVIFDKSYTKEFTVAKQSSDTHTSLISQYVAQKYLSSPEFAEHLSFCRETYRRKSSLMIQTLRETMSPRVKMSTPEGGLFMMLFLPDDCDSVEFLEKAMDCGVACIPGCAFTIDPETKTNAVRLCYSSVSDEQIVEGCKIIGKVTREIFG